MRPGVASISERHPLLAAPHMAPIEGWRQRLVEAGHRMPHADPLDGGVEARLLLLLETPGPGGEGARFVSRDNPTGTARNITRFMAAAGIDRRETVIWNAVPWIVHQPGATNRALRRGEIAAGLAALPGFLALLPDLQVVVLSGRVAAEAEPVIVRERPGVPVLRMPHPSPTYVCTSPAIAERMVETLCEARRVLEERPLCRSC